MTFLKTAAIPTAVFYLEWKESERTVIGTDRVAEAPEV